MALEAVVFPQDPFTYGCKDYMYSLVGGFQGSEDKALVGIINNNKEHNLHANWESSSSPSVLQNVKDQWDSHSSPEPTPTNTTTGRRKRRRTKSTKNKEEIENQRMTHIAVERNRRKQMNEYLAVLRSLMPPSYVQRGDQASIIGGAINFVKELEQLLQCMKCQKKTKEQGQVNGLGDSSPFSEFFMFPQYSTRATQSNTGYPATSDGNTAQNHSWAVADIEVTLVDSHANIKILSKKRPGLLLKMVVGLQSIGLIILHLNVTTVDDMVLTSVSVKVEEGCQLNTVDEIAAAVNQLSLTVHEEAAFS
ncbi:transcription factor bHLH96 [Abrus precatorius]|uniref:Transcription factor bHLH96 n=1 Tax=Abrus precatorius TaxID=3816 RepID=A0A8B8JNW7_ABRPR|nr:transcription factor bHLH96 [Abrus precatorius]